MMSKNVIEEIDLVVGNLIKGLEEKLRRASEDAAKAFIIIEADNVFLRYATDLIFSCFYKQYGLIDYLSDRDYYSHMLETGIRGTSNPLIEIIHALPIIKFVADWFIDRFTVTGIMMRDIKGFIEKQTRLNLEAKQQMAKAKQQGLAFDLDDFTLKDGTRFKRNMIDPFIDSFHEGKVTELEYMNSSIFLFFAGIKTSADALTRLLYRLACHHQIQQKLRESVIKDGPGSEFLGWCINESLRLDPPSPAGCSRQVSRDIEVEGGVVPKKTMVFTPPNTIHLMPEYWGEDAEQYKPERWKNADEFHPMQFIPFGAGRRGCPGKEFALCEIRRLVCNLLTRYRIERCSKTSDSKLFRGPFYSFTIYEASTFIKIMRL